MAPEDETIGEFLDHLGKMVKVREGVDADLAEIVVQHILTPRNLSSRMRRSSLVFSEQPPLRRVLNRAC